MDRTIDFTIIGAQKAGTTSLYGYVAQHPDVFVPAMKEIGYFANDRLYDEGEQYLETFYRDANDESVIGHAYVTIMLVEEAAERLHEHNPSMRLIASLRNPIDRAYSAYWHARRNGIEDLSFEEAIEREQSGGNTTFEEQATRSYVGGGEYMRRLEPFIERFEREQLLVLLADDLRLRREETVARVFRHIGADPEVPVDVSTRENTAQLPRVATVQRLITTDYPEARVRRGHACDLAGSRAEEGRRAGGAGQPAALRLSRDGSQDARALARALRQAQPAAVQVAGAGSVGLGVGDSGRFASSARRSV